MDLSNLIIIVPARKGSKRIKNKNFKLLNNYPLIEYTFAFIKKFDNNITIFFSSDYKISNKYFKKYNLFYHKRSSKLSTSKATTIDVIKDLLSNIPYRKEQVVVLLQPTYPLRDMKVFLKGLHIMQKEKKCDSCASYVESKFDHPWKITTIDKNFKTTQYIKKNSKLIKEKSYRTDGAFYFAKRHVIEKNNSMIGNNHYGLINNPNIHVNIDNLIDWELAKILLKKYSKYNFINK